MVVVSLLGQCHVVLLRHCSVSLCGCRSLTVLRLPPGFQTVVCEGGDHVLDGVTERVCVLPGVARETFGVLLKDRSEEVLKGQYTLTHTAQCVL